MVEAPPPAVSGSHPPAAILPGVGPTLSELDAGIVRITMPLPWALDHVHCYAVPGASGWTLIDCGLGTHATLGWWREALDQLDGRPVELTAKEFDLLAFFLSNPGAVLSRDVLLDRVWGVEYPGGTRTVDVHVAQLRRKLGRPALIRTLRGSGYKAVAT